ncbi:MAG: D-aminoacyl-tRNA deacylase [Eubacteriaceae bacterium]
MIAVVQRVLSSRVTVDNVTVGEIKKGLNVLLGVKQGDNEKDAQYLAKKICDLRIFEDNNGKMNLSIKDIAGQMLIISQFTLLADTKKGNRPSFTNAAEPDQAQKLYEEFIKNVGFNGISAQQGIFGANMLVEIFNDGPVSIILDSRI